MVSSHPVKNAFGHILICLHQILKNSFELARVVDVMKMQGKRILHFDH